jgi:ligand-binding sensor domain-containing protein/putative methionine-R-sulfoxide reductase with GAF domain/anti-sigma regulatory factor (Ser/Thr protein kinase)
MKRIIIIALAFGIRGTLLSQTNPVFYTLNTTNGLSYTGVNSICIGQKGNLWIATGNGLNMFNGRNVEKYYASEYPQLENSNILSVNCDKDNRIWMIMAVGYVSMLDEKRKMHRVSLRSNGDRLRAFSFLQTPDERFYIYAQKGIFQFTGQQGVNKLDSIDGSQFKFLPLQNYEPYRSMGTNTAFAFDENYYLLVFKGGILKVNYKTNIVESRLDIPNAHALQACGKDELLYYDVGDGKLKIVNIVTMKISYPLRGLKDQFGKEVTAVINEAKPVNNRQYLLTTKNGGIYIWDTVSKKIFNYRHSVVDPTSICNNTQSYIAVGQKGWIFTICNPNGISYFKLNEVVNNQYIFTSADGKEYDGYIAGIATKDNNTYYFGTSSGMLEWKRSTNTTNFIDLKDPDGKSIFKDFEVTSIVLDDNGNIWATVKDGLIVIDKRKKLVKRFRKEDGSLKQRALSRIILGPDGFIWACGPNGICRINTKTFEMDNLGDTPLKQFDSAYVMLPLFTDKDNLWLFVDKNGIYHYNLPAKKLEELDGFKKYKKNESAFDFGVDKTGNVYLGNTHGLKIFFKDGREKIITRKDGLLIDRVEGLLLDRHNRIWIGNDIGLACYNPADSSLRTFDERYGLSIYGFRVGSYFQTSNGEFIFGTPKGVQYFHPDSLFNKTISLNVSINKIETKNIAANITETASFKLAARDNQVTFYFGSVDFTPHLRTYYEYKLVDLDKDWIKIVDQNSVRYNSLSPGKYVFKVRISNDNKNWQEADNEVTVMIASPFYRTWWFKLLGAVLAIVSILVVINYYRKKQLQKRSELEAELVITYFASQINSHTHTDELLWDIAKNCISKLHFEDCVIYLKDEEKNILVQKAAYGPKNPVDFTIHKPIEIPVGKGITGTVAQTGIAEIINDTEKDSRYILDDKRRYAEIAVPVLINDKVVAVIDSENSRKNFFTARHLQVLSTIAALCANQIQKTKAEEDKQKATIELLQNKQKATESLLQSLRLQMNPHFLFNALNSIQQMILANEEMVATKYLSRFSKLLRAILVHSDKETISLKEELEILNLYVELESIRFKESFHYKIICDETIDADEIKIPTLLVQPFVENAIWHGLMHKEGERDLKVEFTEEGEFIKCIIEDNGIGRKKAAEMKITVMQDKKHTSRGIEVSKERLKTLRTKDGREGSISIIDMANENGKASGTRVEIYFPFIN